MLKTELVSNSKVTEANIHELFVLYNDVFFEGVLEGKVLLEWSKRMTLCAGICYCDQVDK